MSNVQKKKSGEVSKSGIVFRSILLAVMIFGLFIVGKLVDYLARSFYRLIFGRQYSFWSSCFNG